MSQITKCYKVTVVLAYWGALGEVSELSYKSLLIISSKRSYCRGPKGLQLEVRARRAPRLLVSYIFQSNLILLGLVSSYLYLIISLSRHTFFSYLIKSSLALSLPTSTSLILLHHLTHPFHSPPCHLLFAC